MTILSVLIDKLIERAMKTPYTHIKDYMERYWLVPYNKWLPSARIHHILSSDDARAFHDHPWPYLTVILKGGYFEVRPQYDSSGLYIGETKKWHGPGSVLVRRSSSYHRLELPEGRTAWTLFITGRYRRKWGFLVQPAMKVPHTEYLGEPESPFLPK